MNLKEQQKQAKAFIERWGNRGNERQDTQSFWLDLLNKKEQIKIFQRRLSNQMVRF